MIRELKKIKDVVDWGLCTGCGACYFNCDKGRVALVNVESFGIRPRFDDCSTCTSCLAICPGNRVDGTGTLDHESNHPDLGPVLEIWEGHASDAEIRFRGSSGGVLTALALFCLEQEEMGSVLHTAMDESKPWTNKTVQSFTRSELLERTGSRYAPSSPCAGLHAVEESEKPCVFIGKPCDASAVSMLSGSRPQLNRKIGLNLTFFCAGTPSTRGTLDLMESLGIDRAQVTAVRYRGEGWPGRFSVSSGNRTNGESLSYAESWGRLADYRPLRCHLCPDGLGQSADIACGDAWEHFGGTPDAGRSIVIVRTQRGSDILRRAREAEYVELERVGSEAVLAAQHNLLRRRKELFGRLFAMKLLWVPAPNFSGFSLFRSWTQLSITRRFQIITGTLRRMLLRGLWRKRPFG